MKTFLKICLYTFVGLMLIGFIGTLFDDKKTDTAEGKTALSDSADSTVTKAQAKPVTKEDFAERLKRETESWKKHKPGVG